MGKERDPFKMLRRLKERASVDIPKPEKPLGLEGLLDSFDKFYHCDAAGKLIEPEELYVQAEKSFGGLQFCAKDVEGFSNHLAEIAKKYTDTYETSKLAGIFLSAAANKALEKEEKIEIDITGLSKSSRIGMYQKEGIIVVTGDTYAYLGYKKTGGSLFFRGNAGSEVGLGMKGGGIYIKGEMKRLSEEIENGEIWLGTEKVWPDMINRWKK